MVVPNLSGLVRRLKVKVEGSRPPLVGAKCEGNVSKDAKDDSHKVGVLVVVCLASIMVAGKMLSTIGGPQEVVDPQMGSVPTHPFQYEPNTVQGARRHKDGGSVPMKPHSLDVDPDSFYSEDEMQSGNETNTVVRTCPDSQPLVKLLPNFMPSSMFESFRDDLHASASMTDSSLHQSNFGHTSGWMIRFNAEGIKQVQSHDIFKIIMPFFEKARNPYANAFVINYLVCHQPPKGENAVGLHLDNSVALSSKIKDEYLHVAHQVNVLYLDVPEGMEGGQLEVSPFERGDSGLDKTVVIPGENLMAEFRGDAFHKIGNMKLPNGKPRVGIVLEQYKITSEFYQYLIPFCVGDECRDLM